MSIYSDIVAKVEAPLASIGLMSGENAIQRRFIFGAVLGGLLVTYIKPECMFENGVARPFKAWTPTDDGIRPTWLPWWSVPVVFSIYFSMFI